jgi:hypothetical protein
MRLDPVEQGLLNQAQRHVIGDYAALVGETLITRCPIWCPFDFGFYAIQCRSVRDQNPKNIQKTNLLDSCCGAKQISAKSHFESGAFKRALPVLLYFLSQDLGLRFSRLHGRS